MTVLPPTAPALAPLTTQVSEVSVHRATTVPQVQCCRSAVPRGVTAMRRVSASAKLVRKATSVSPTLLASQTPLVLQVELKGVRLGYKVGQISPI